ncbi:MAG: response regulator [Terriglobales bacterium]
MKILLADDSMTAQSMGKKILAEAGYDVVAVSNGAAAIKKIAETKPDIVLLDVYMPGYSGLEVCEKIKSGPPAEQIPVLLTVGKMEPFKVEEGIKAKADGLIIKPFEATDLLTVVGKLAEMVPPPPTVAPLPTAGEATSVEEFEVAVAPPQPAAESPEFELARAPAMPLDIFEEALATPPVAETSAVGPLPHVAGTVAASVPAEVAIPPSPPASGAPEIDMREFEAAIAQVTAQPEATSKSPTIEIELTPADAAPIAEPEAAAVPPAPAAEPQPASVTPAPEAPDPATMEPAPTFTIEFSETPPAAPVTAEPEIVPAVEQPAFVAPPSEELQASAGTEVAQPWKMEFTLEPAADPAATEFNLETLEPEQATAAEIVPPPSASASAAAQPVMPQTETPVPEPQVEAAAEAPAFEIRLEPEAPSEEPEIELIFVPEPADVAVTPEPALEVIPEERGAIAGDIPPDPTWMGRREPVAVQPDVALITDIHDLSAYVAGDAALPGEETPSEKPRETAPANAADAAPAEAAAAAESPEIALFGPNGTQAEAHNARLSAALDAYDQHPEPRPERATAAQPDTERPVLKEFSQPPPATEPEPSLETAAEQVFAAAAASIAVPPPQPTAASSSVPASPPVATVAQVAAASPALQKLIAAIVDHVIERLKPEMLAELERRRSQLVEEITRELKDAGN